MNQFYYGDNLKVLREHIEDESVDQIYLGPPVNSKRDYNLLFKSPRGGERGADERAVAKPISELKESCDSPAFAA